MSGLVHTPAHPNDAEATATGSHPPAHKPDPTIQHATQGGLAAASASSSSQQPNALDELESLKSKLKSALRQFPDFPSPGILFEDILPIFADPTLHHSLVRALELHVSQAYEDLKPDVIVGLEARGFLFGPSLAMKLGVGFAPVRKKGKLPGPCETAGYQKEYGEDFFQIQADAIKPGQKVLIVDDIIATGGSAAAAGALVKKLGGEVLGYAFLLELDFLKGRAKLDARVDTLLTGQLAKE